MRYVILPLLAIFELAAAQEWNKFTSPNFELYTTTGDKPGRELIQYFEQVRDLFMRIKSSTVTTRLPVTIIAFKNAKEYQPWSPGAATAAYYLADELRDYIVMSGAGSENYPAAVHEYTHLLIRHSGLKMPVWLNEGFAEVHSTVRPHGGKIIVGDVPAGRGYVLTENKWLPLETLLGVTHESEHYNERDKKGMLYSQSWLLTHMLMLGDDYRERFSQFVGAASAPGTSGAAAFLKVYGKSTQEIEKDLRMYLRGGMKAVLYDTKLQKMAPPEMRSATPLETGMTFARLAAFLRRKDDANQRFASLAAQFPGQWEIAEAQAHLAWREGNLDEARTYFAQAVAANSTSWKTYWDYARMLGNSGSSENIIKALKKAIELNPELAEARVMLGFESYRAGRFNEAISALTAVKRIDPSRAHSYFMVLAHSNLQLKAKEAARKAASSAAEHASSASEQLAARRLIEYIDFEPPVRAQVQEAIVPAESSESPGPSAAPLVAKEMMLTVNGSLQHIDCLGNEARIRVQAGGRAIQLLVRDPQRVTIKNSAGSAIDFVCGPQKGLPVNVEYVPNVDARHNTIGEVRTLEFHQ